jgi:hypothetical protein
MGVEKNSPGVDNTDVDVIARALRATLVQTCVSRGSLKSL